jgi:hypothetical protein
MAKKVRDFSHLISRETSDISRPAPALIEQLVAHVSRCAA